MGNNVISTAFFSFFFFFFFFLLLRATHRAYGSSQARSGIGAQPLAYTTATTTQDLSRIFDLHCSLQQCQILNPLSEPRNRTCILVDTSQIHFC